MSDYQPTSRRPVVDVFRKTAQSSVRLFARWGIHPDAVSYMSILATGRAAYQE
ncbi:MAG: hypothetical protein ACE5NA_12675 [Nitrospiraceae bacterium]